jgi:protein-L-isoaspartate(D-aspartate) O-methyltransferase
MAALLAHKAQHVTTLEIDPDLARFARANLQRAGVMNATVVEADGANGWRSEAPFDVMVLSGSVAALPEALLAQLKTGGRLVAIVGHEPVMRAVLVTRNGDTGLNRQVLFDTVAPRLLGFDEPTKFRF